MLSLAPDQVQVRRSTWADINPLGMNEQRAARRADKEMMARLFSFQSILAYSQPLPDTIPPLPGQLKHEE
jgi:hypothetical protein